MNATLILNELREKSLLRRHPWIFEGAVHSYTGVPRSGDTVDVISSEGVWLAKAAYSPTSQIRARVWSFTKDEVIDNVFFTNKIKDAYAVRKALGILEQTNAYRLVAAESDGLPGVTIDVYDYVVVIQLLSAGAEKHRKKIVWAIEQLYPNATIHERSDVDVRKKEGLQPVVQTIKGTLPNEIEIVENEVKILVDLKHGHKTGFYLDQRDNRQIAASLLYNKTVLNCFCYTGMFGVMALAQGARAVTNVDASEQALTFSKRNTAINALDLAKAEFLKADVFQLLRDYKNKNMTFDAIILDPPKFVDNRNQLAKASRGYKDINRIAMELLNPNGLLFTFSCSGLMPADLFLKIVADAALDANREAKVIKRLSQSADHAVSSAFPEGYYLKGLVLIVK